MRGGIFSNPTSFGATPGGGIFNKPGLGAVRSGGIFSLGALGGVVEDQISQCIKNRTSGGCAFTASHRQELIDDCLVKSGYTKSSEQCDPCRPVSEATARSECEKFVNTSVDCAPKCKAFRQDSPEWAACIQKCHGYPPVDYSAEKAGCAAKGMIYSWLEGGCVSKEKYASCPSGTVYATYPDGSEKCIGIPTDLTKAACPVGTKLQKVSGGEACVSPVVPGVKPPPAPKPTPVRPVPAPAKQVRPPASESKAGIPLAIAAVAVLGAIGLYLYKNKDEEPEPASTPKLMSRANCSCY